MSKRILEKIPEIYSIFDTKYIFEFDGVNTIHDYREELIINDIMFFHGYRGQFKHAEYVNQNCCTGHTHRGGVQYFKKRNQTIWELNAGCLVDQDSEAMSYTHQKHTKSTQGFGYIDEYGPRFIPL